MNPGADCHRKPLLRQGGKQLLVRAIVPKGDEDGVGRRRGCDGQGRQTLVNPVRAHLQEMIAIKHFRRLVRQHVRKMQAQLVVLPSGKFLIDEPIVPRHADALLLQQCTGCPGSKPPQDIEDGPTPPQRWPGSSLPCTRRGPS